MNRARSFLFLLSLLLLPAAAFASDAIPTNSNNLGTHVSPLGDSSDFNLNTIINTTFGNALNAVAALLGALALLYLIYSGFQYITAGAAPEKAKKARTQILLIVVGIVFMIAAYGIVTLVTSVLNNAAHQV